MYMSDLGFKFRGTLCPHQKYPGGHLNFLGDTIFYILHTWNMQSYAKKLAITFFVKFSD